MVNTYLIWNIKYNQWRMEDFIGFTDEVEFAGTFTEEYLRKNTGMYDYRTGDYTNNIIINAITLDKRDFEERLINLSSSQKKALKKAIMIERKRKGLAVEIILRDEQRICPYCKKQLIKIARRLDKTYCGRCNNPIMEIEEW